MKRFADEENPTLVGAVSCTGPRREASASIEVRLPRVIGVCARVGTIPVSRRRLTARAGTGHGPYRRMTLDSQRQPVQHDSCDTFSAMVGITQTTEGER